MSFHHCYEDYETIEKFRCNVCARACVNVAFFKHEKAHQQCCHVGSAPPPRRSKGTE